MLFRNKNDSWVLPNSGNHFTDGEIPSSEKILNTSIFIQNVKKLLNQRNSKELSETSNDRNNNNTRNQNDILNLPPDKKTEQKQIKYRRRKTFINKNRICPIPRELSLILSAPQTEPDLKIDFQTKLSEFRIVNNTVNMLCDKKNILPPYSKKIFDTMHSLPQTPPTSAQAFQIKILSGNNKTNHMVIKQQRTMSYAFIRLEFIFVDFLFLYIL